VERENGTSGRLLAEETAHARRFAHDGKVIEGKDGWLFLANDTNRVLDQHTGAVRLNKRQLEQWRGTLEDRAAWFAERDIAHQFVIAPNTHSIYPEYLPDGFPLSEERPVRQLLEHLRDAGPTIEPLYPLDELKSAKAVRPVCLSVDAHWNDWGAYVTYRLIMRRLRRIGISAGVIPEDRISFFEMEFEGDLAMKAGLPKKPQYVGRMPWRRSRRVYDNGVINRGHVLVLECDTAAPMTCVVVGDSYAGRMMWNLAESFQRLVYANLGAALDRGFIEQEQPDVVVHVLSERFLMIPPDDENDPSLRDWVSLKREKGMVHPR
jgi:alginate O-acetyltransferase complex protein AlgJ